MSITSRRSRIQIRITKPLTCNALFGLGVPELAVIAGVAALLFGPKNLPQVGRSFGKTIKGFQQAAKEFESELKKEPNSTDETPSEELTDVSEQQEQDTKMSITSRRSRIQIRITKPLTCNALFGLGVPELAVIAGVAALLFGPKNLPQVGRSFGKTIKGFQQAAKEFESELKKEPNSTDETPSEELTDVSEQQEQDTKVSSNNKDNV
ncbi:hypothetical protein TanjilG_10123 [Lupinus angustifolius]|uniref:Sec-independent protein translocase protein TatA n=1 Tax=Lupinus angustifolius TaxID=3871 RepID=A0A1J7H329_LUPAN|nr:hypothetical protein TanjilG_10123 [Lupinus angustifolius]